MSSHAARRMRQRRLSLVLVLLLSAASSAAADPAIAPVIEHERAELADGCATVTFLDGFATAIDIDGDGLMDAHVDYGALECDSSRMMYCGSSGCSQHVYLQRSDGRFEKIAEFLAYEMRFDRPQDASFIAVLRGPSCGRTNIETCMMRYRVSGSGVEALHEEAGTRR